MFFSTWYLMILPTSRNKIEHYRQEVLPLFLDDITIVSVFLTLTFQKSLKAFHKLPYMTMFSIDMRWQALTLQIKDPKSNQWVILYFSVF